VRVSVRARSPVSGAEAARLARAVLRAEGVGGALLSIALVGRRRIRSLNRRHLGHDRETDVIAFTLGTETPKAELRRLVVHGVLHVLGYRHPSGAGRATSPMWRRQERLLARLVPGR
jgi:probable rRNA maturation factor